jgi:CDGSH-type Zn-finger protein/uncharacterized Fe-S cluster protein YjdI
MEKKYSNHEITIVWKGDLCIHSGICAQKLPHVYNPKKRPWIVIENATTEELTAQIKACPSGALSYYHNDKKEESTDPRAIQTGVVAEKAPLIIELEAGKTYAWCSCGLSKNQPWCDGSHLATAMTPKVFTADDSKKAAICMCKQSENAPYCDGSHMDLDD